MLEKLKRENLLIKLKKCKFRSRKIKFLEYKIEIVGIKPEKYKENKIRDIKKL
ncbi:hypothetical protein RIR_e17011_A0A2N1MEB8_9GLOM [Rhizophagus irregularis DAOM 181602=DAOM 197198]|nr:hypothetical protein RIR_e17011_A0A2N1MEB8_9GLOM [Rhizophagus irregularis DAOM 181602=DAOM 197198]